MYNLTKSDISKQVNEGVLAHQKRFYFVDHSPDIDTDSLVELIWDDFTFGKRHVPITGIQRTFNTIVIEFAQKMCYRFGDHKLGNIHIELIRKKDLEARLKLLGTKSRQSKWPELK